jgi:hypothetical protein
MMQGKFHSLGVLVSKMKDDGLYPCQSISSKGPNKIFAHYNNPQVRARVNNVSLLANGYSNNQSICIFYVNTYNY